MSIFRKEATEQTWVNEGMSALKQGREEDVGSVSNAHANSRSKGAATKEKTRKIRATIALHNAVSSTVWGRCFLELTFGAFLLVVRGLGNKNRGIRKKSSLSWFFSMSFKIVRKKQSLTLFGALCRDHKQNVKVK